MNARLLAGVVAAALAAVSWSLSFIVPFVIGGYSVFDFNLVQFAFSGVLGLALLARHADAAVRLAPADWLVGCALGLIGYACYFLAVMGAAIYAGPVIAPAFLGLVPVVLGVAGNLRERSVPGRALVVPLGLAALGLTLVNGSALTAIGAGHPRSLLAGIPLALAAVGLWTTFGLVNQGALARRPAMDAGVWAALIMIGAAVSMLAFLPVGLALGVFEFPRLGLQWPAAAPLLLWGFVLAACANVGGATAWTFASQRLPVVLAAQMITVEPTSATILGLIVHRRWPTPMEALGMVVLVAGVLAAIRMFARGVPSAASRARE